MRIDQRNAGAAVTTNNAFPVDRFVVNTTASGYEASRSTVAPAGYTNSLKYLVTSSGTHSGSSNARIRQIFEGYNVADLGFGTSDAKQISVSFNVRASIAGTYCVSINNGVFDRSYVLEYTVSSADTWEYKTVTIPGDTSGTWATDNTAGMWLVFDLGSDPAVRNTTPGSWQAGSYSRTTNQVNVQLEVGSVATEFERRPYGTELSLCERYYQQVKGLVGVAASSSLINITADMRTRMRDDPSVSRTTGTLSFGDMVSQAYQSTGSVSIGYGFNYLSPTLSVNGFTGLTSYRAYRHEPSSLYTSVFALSAEL
jgi:hypothetical protein